ncbi:unnamed protein product [Rhizophagus irregularis]|nr:unnamed protein product [Rhizophagus irregularis]CAB5304078.1 unnamed protein product [Rhizophagus irregularis]
MYHVTFLNHLNANFGPWTRIVSTTSSWTHIVLMKRWPVLGRVLFRRPVLRSILFRQPGLRMRENLAILGFLRVSLNAWDFIYYNEMRLFGHLFCHFHLFYISMRHVRILTRNRCNSSFFGAHVDKLNFRREYKLPSKREKDDYDLALNLDYMWDRNFGSNLDMAESCFKIWNFLFYRFRRTRSLEKIKI